MVFHLSHPCVDSSTKLFGPTQWRTLTENSGGAANERACDDSPTELFGLTNSSNHVFTKPLFDSQTDSFRCSNTSCKACDDSSTNSVFRPTKFSSFKPFKAWAEQDNSSNRVFFTNPLLGWPAVRCSSFLDLKTPTSAFANTAFGQSWFGGQMEVITVVSYPAITEDDGGTSGQTAKLESISAMPAYKDKRLESFVTIAGADYCVIAVDYTGDHTKISQLSEKSVMASSSFQADLKALQKVLSARRWESETKALSNYQLREKKPNSCPAMGRVLSGILYHQRYFPYPAFNVLGGLDSEGKGCVFTYYGGAVSRERVGYSSQGSGSTLLPAKDAVTPLSETEAVELAKTYFAEPTKGDINISEAVELAKTYFAEPTKGDINTGDKVEIVVLNASGLRREYMDLRKD